ncbi:hypothetical protein [Cyclobacterium roseum]|uniref:hypothetical protein n=1 Tax=Cyclobacterium roseum TaxID=2666137 RepID=UPI00139099EF|nr:hypothetical protein [Cyclobacterium roseum]
MAREYRLYLGYTNALLLPENNPAKPGVTEMVIYKTLLLRLSPESVEYYKKWQVS